MRTKMNAMDFIFCVLLKLVVQWSCFAIPCTPYIFHSNYLPMRLCLCWIRGTGEIRLLRVYRFFIGSIFRWWCTRYIVDKWVSNCQLVDGHSGTPTEDKPWSLRDDSNQQGVESCSVMAVHSMILGDIFHSECPVGSCWIISFRRWCIEHASWKCGPYFGIAQYSDKFQWCVRGYSLLPVWSLREICLKAS